MAGVFEQCDWLGFFPRVLSGWAIRHDGVFKRSYWLGFLSDLISVFGQSDWTSIGAVQIPNCDGQAAQVVPPREILTFTILAIQETNEGHTGSITNES